MTASPAVSVVVPTYNRERFLPRALDSIIAQTFDDWEIVVVDDGSTDNTPVVLDQYRQRLGDRLFIMRQANQGVSPSRNRAIEACRGQYIAFLDSDDEFLPHKLERQMALFDARPELGLVYGDFAYVDLNGVRFESAFDSRIPLGRTVPYEEISPGLCVCTGNLFDSLIHGYFIATIVGMVRQEVLGQHIRFPGTCGYSEEWLFYLRVSRVCRAGFINEPLCLHHFTEGSLTRTDQNRNSRRYGKLLETIIREFDDVDRPTRRMLQRKLAANHRQLGYDALRNDDSMEALQHFASALRYQVSTESIYRMMQAALSSVRLGRRTFKTAV